MNFLQHVRDGVPCTDLTFGSATLMYQLGSLLVFNAKPCDSEELRSSKLGQSDKVGILRPEKASKIAHGWSGMHPALAADSPV